MITRLILMSTIILLGCSNEEPKSKTKLVLFIVADQFPAEFTERYKPAFTSGLKQLLDKGAQFTKVFHEHSSTETCPGHASLISGSHPKRTGIIANSWIDRKQLLHRYCVDDLKYQRSPRNMLTSSLGDWIKKSNSKSKVFAASGKDRAAITLGGHRADSTYWFNRHNGSFVSSKYYAKNNPGWLRAFNQKKLLLEHFGEPWRPLPSRASLRKQVGVLQPDQGLFPQTFPHSLGSPTLAPSSKYYADIYNSPFLDEHLLALTKELILHEQLGQDEHIDYLGLSFSALDTVGHEYGPHSPEVFDTLTRLDLLLGELFEFLDKRLGMDNVLVIFSSDHGVQPLPELAHHTGSKGHRQNAEDIACIQAVGRRLSNHFNAPNLFHVNFHLNFAQVKQAGINKQELDTLAKEWLSACKIVERVWSYSELATPQPNPPYYRKLQENSFHPERSPDYMPLLKKNHLHKLNRGTNHGTPYNYDTHVPLIFMGQGIASQEISERAASVDAAATIAALIKVNPTEKIEGKNLSGLVLQKTEQTG